MAAIDRVIRPGVEDREGHLSITWPIVALAFPSVHGPELLSDRFEVLVPQR